MRDLGGSWLVRGGWHALLVRLPEVDGLELVQDELHEFLVILDLFDAHCFLPFNKLLYESPHLDLGLFLHGEHG